jgi:hypothetical protein
MRLGFCAIGAVVALGVCGCSSQSVVEAPAPEPVSAAIRPSPHPVDKLVGSWGVASFRADKDRKRTEAMAKSHCDLPYEIKKGPTDGVIMHVADDPELYELTLKGAADGKTYLGFAAPPGDVSDREVVFFSDNLFILRFVDRDANTRYGNMIYVRC